MKTYLPPLVSKDVLQQTLRWQRVEGGGGEAMVESYYSVMSFQKQTGGQHNETLALR